jgi:malate synthase
LLEIDAVTAEISPATVWRVLRHDAIRPWLC